MRPVSPAYRLYIAPVNIRASDFSSQPDQRTARLEMDGIFMGSGRVNLTSGDFKLAIGVQDFSINFALVNTQLPSLNEMSVATGVSTCSPDSSPCIPEAQFMMETSQRLRESRFLRICSFEV